MQVPVNYMVEASKSCSLHPDIAAAGEVPAGVVGVTVGRFSVLTLKGSKALLMT